MADRLPVCTGQQVKRALERAGFALLRINGSHHIMRQDGPPVRNVTVPVHGGKTLKRATVAAIIKQAGLTVEGFISFLR
jgi:predicted RNA binding protein YcfA (HicA-like mRNA interferase family)